MRTGSPPYLVRSAGEGAKAGRVGRGVEAALQCGAGIDARIVPQAGAEQLDVAQVRACRRHRIRHRHHGIAIIGNEQRIRAAELLRHGARRRGAIGTVFLEGDDAPTAPRHRCFHRGFDDIAIGIVGHQHGDGALSDAGGIVDDAVDVGLRQEREQIDTASGDAGIGREGDDGDAARARDLRHRRNRLREQWPEDDLGAFVDRLLRADLRALRAAIVVLDQELDVRVLELGQCHLGGVAHGLRGEPGIAGGGERQNHGDLHAAGAGSCRLLRGPCRLGRRRGARERVGELAETLLHAGAGRQHGRTEQQAKCAPASGPRRSGSRSERLWMTRAHHGSFSSDPPSPAGHDIPSATQAADSGILSANS
ncbi:hypothetical protein ACVIU7_001813 [Bradyrhizobium liaoningense]|nr:hypothetical protein GCM10007858_30120 [Bradyrhizobium liaoningense]